MLFYTSILYYSFEIADLDTFLSSRMVVLPSVFIDISSVVTTTEYQQKRR